MSPEGMVDIHGHVLPGIDDGARDVAMSLEMLRAAARGGTTDFIATPHQHPGRHPNGAAAIRAAYDLLGEALEEAAGTGEALPRVHLGAEVHLDSDVARGLERGDKLALAGGPFLLLELPDTFSLRGVEELVFELRLAGRTPVIAHPERNGQVLRDPSQLERLVELGALAQVTGSSVAGDFGTPCLKATQGLLAAGLVHVVASDAHDTVRRTADLARARSAAAGLLGEERTALLFERNPRAVLEGGAVEALSPCPPPEGPVERLARALWRRA